jgi:hypothetical protein
MPAAYATRDGGDAKSKKQSMADLKLRRLQELNSRLKEDLERPRSKVSDAAMRYGQPYILGPLDVTLKSRLTLPAALLTTATQPATIWCHRSGDKSTKRRIRTTHRAVPQTRAAVQSCSLEHFTNHQALANIGVEGARELHSRVEL